MSTDHSSNNHQPYTFSEQVGHLLRKAYQRHLAIFQQNVGDSQLTAVQFVTLCALRDHGPSSQTELVKATAVDQATIRGIVDRLKARDLISLDPDPEDRRKVICSLTDSGLQLRLRPTIFFEHSMPGSLAPLLFPPTKATDCSAGNTHATCYLNGSATYPRWPAPRRYGWPLHHLPRLFRPHDTRP